MKINLNEIVTVTLTKKGAEILTEHEKKYLAGIHKNRVYQQGHEFRTHLWDIMNIFGKHLYNGCEIPFEQNEVQIVSQQPN